MTNRPKINYEKILAENGLPTTEQAVLDAFDKIVKDENLITNTSRMSPFWRLISAIAVKPVLWLKDALINNVLKNMFLLDASGPFVDLFAWAVNVERKESTALNGVITFYKDNPDRVVTIPAGTEIQTERINGVIYTVTVNVDSDIPAGVAAAAIAVTASEPGAAFNLAPGYYRILPKLINGVVRVVNEENWIIQPGADSESDDDLRARVKNQFNLVGQYHTDAVYRGLISRVAGVSADHIYFIHDAPRGPGTANAYLLLDSGINSQPFIDAVNDYVMAQGHHGHGDDLRCFPLPETQHDLNVICYLNDTNLSTERRADLVRDVTDMVRCAFRENTNYDVHKVFPYSRFSFSRLGEELHQAFFELESVQFSLTDIVSGLSIPRLTQLTVVIADD